MADTTLFRRLDSEALPADLRKRVLDWMYTLFAHHTNESQAIGRAAAALGYGLDPKEYVSTFPGSTVNTIVNVPVTPPAEPTPSPPDLPNRPPDPCTTGAPAATQPPPVSPVPTTTATAPSPPSPPMAIPVVVTKDWPTWVKVAAVVGLIAAGVGVGWGVGSLRTIPGAPATPPSGAAVTVDKTWQLKIVETEKP
jgi:hypothetical protein